MASVPYPPSTTEHTPPRAVEWDVLHDPMYLLRVVERCAALEARGAISANQRQFWADCRAELLRLARSQDAGTPGEGEVR